MNRRARKVLICIFSVLLLGYFPPGMGNCQDDELLKNPREMTFPPRFGEHNREIYGGILGFSEEKLLELKAKEVI